jgi:hypothetical protein
MELGVWGFCAGDETIPPKLTAPILASNASQTEITTLNREYKDDVRPYTDATHRNDKSLEQSRTSSNPINSSTFMAKGQRKKHADSHTGLA